MVFFQLSLAQTAGINYQALILDNNGTEVQIPGEDLQGKQLPLVSEDVNFRFSITGDPAGNFVQYFAEEQSTTTDANGLVSLIVGEGLPIFSTFDAIEWDGTPKFLNVEIEIVKDGGGYTFLDSQKILYLPQSIGNNNNTNVTTRNGLSLNGNTIELGGVLIKPTTIFASPENTLAIRGLEIGDMINDRLVVIDRNTGELKQVTTPSFLQEQQVLSLAVDGQTQFSAPLPLVDANKVSVYRNGVRIGFTIIDLNTLQLEDGVVCYENDEIRIVQIY